MKNGTMKVKQVLDISKNLFMRKFTCSTTNITRERNQDTYLPLLFGARWNRISSF